MTITTPLPTAPSTTRPVTFSAEMDAFLASLAQFQSELNAYAASLSPIGRNMLINPAFQVYQETPGATADDSYGGMPDCWYTLTQTSLVTPSKIIDQENGYTDALRITQSNGTAQRFGFAQIIYGKNCKHLRNTTATLQARIRMSVTTTLRYAVLGWTGTENGVTSDFVNDWTSALFTAGNFFNSTTLSVLATGSVALTANTFASITPLVATLGTTFNNLAVMFWTDSTQATGVTLDAEYISLEGGSAANPFERRPYAQELSLCKFYFNILQVGAGANFSVGVLSASTLESCFSFPEMRTLPSIVFPAYGTGSGQLYAGNSAGALAGGSWTVNDISLSSARLLATGVTATAGQAGLCGNNTGGANIKLDCRL